MAAIARSETRATARSAPATGGSAFALTVHTTLEAAEPAWRWLEASGAVLTPYQRFDWIAAWHAAAEAPEDLAVLVVERARRPVALLPLVLHRHLGVTRAAIPGSEIGNADWMIVMPGAERDFGRGELFSLLREAGRQAGGIDVVALFNLPPAWGGIANPLLALPHRPGPNRLHLGHLDADGRFDRLDARRRGNLMQRWNKLGAREGGLELRTATTPAQVESYLQIFLSQRAIRFAQMGIPNVFAEPRFVRFFRQGATAALDMERPAVLVQLLCAGERIVASAIGTIAGTHFSQYINATASDADLARYRLIGLLMHAVVTDAATRGCTSIDMGLGDFEYKLDWTEPTPVHDAIVPLTAKGRLATAAILGGRALKGAIKRHEKLWRLAKSVRAGLGRRQPSGSAR